MRGLERNKKTIWYSAFGSYEGTDEWGNVVPGYGKPKKYKAHVTAGQSRENIQLHGANVVYDRELIVCDMDCPIMDKTRLWIDVGPTKPHDYIVVAPPMKGLNVVRIPVRRVNVSEENRC